MFITIIVSAYFLACNFFGFRMVKIQKANREQKAEISKERMAKNNSVKKLESGRKNSKTKIVENDDIITIENEDIKHTKKDEKSTTKSSKDKKAQPLDDENLNFKKTEKVNDATFLIISAIGGALGVFLGFIILKYRTTNACFMILLPVLIALWCYLIFIFFRIPWVAGL